MTQPEPVYPENIPHKKCLDRGFVGLVDHMGSDTRIVDAARVSYQGGTKKVQDDRNLIRYMLRNKHETPFEKVVFEFHIKTPMFIGEQFLRHRIGSFNKISGRYSVMTDEFYVADQVRKQSTTNNQGSSDEVVTDISWAPWDDPGCTLSTSTQEWIRTSHTSSYECYMDMINSGCSKEQSRGLLPANLYTEFYWTVNLRSLMNFLMLRLDSHAQYEIRVYAQAIYDLIVENCDVPLALEAFQDYTLDAPNITKFELDILHDLIFQLTPQGSGWDHQTDEVLTRLKSLIAVQPSMSKRERAESKLLHYFEEQKE